MSEAASLIPPAAAESQTPTTPIEGQPSGLVPTPPVTPPTPEGNPVQESPTFRGLLGEDGSFRQDADWNPLLKSLGVEKYEGALKKYKTPEELLKGMGNLQGLVGTDTRGVIIPKEDSPEDVVLQYKQAVGAPESAEGYELSLPEGLPDSVQINEDVVGKAKEIAAKYHMPAAALQELMTLSIGHTAESATAMQEAMQTQAAESREAQMEILRKTWKGELDKNLSLAARVGVKLEIPEDDPVFTSANGVRLLVEYAKTQREDSLPITGRDHAVDVKSDFEDMVRNIHHPHHHRYHTDPEFARQQSERLQRALANAR